MARRRLGLGQPPNVRVGKARPSKVRSPLQSGGQARHEFPSSGWCAGTVLPQHRPESHGERGATRMWPHPLISRYHQDSSTSGSWDLLPDARTPKPVRWASVPSTSAENPKRTWKWVFSEKIHLKAFIGKSSVLSK